MENRPQVTACLEGILNDEFHHRGPLFPGMIPTAEDVGRALGVPCASFAHGWDQAQASQPTGALTLIHPAAVIARRKALGLPEEAEVVLLAMAERVGENSALQALLWYLNWRLFCDATCGSPSTPPDLTPTLGDQSGCFYLLVALEFAPALAARHRALGYPDEVTTWTLLKIKNNYENHRFGTGLVGHFPSQLSFLRTFFDSPHVRLGRLAFQIVPFEPFFEPTVEFRRHRSDRTLLALIKDGTRIDEEGLVARSDEPEAWTARLCRREDGVEGFPVDPAGRVLRHSVHVDSRWERFLCDGEEILSLHIPPGGSMDLVSVQESCRLAVSFFETYHNDRPVRAIACRTWFLDPRLAELLPHTANSLSFQRCFYLYPTEPKGDGGLWPIFLRDTADLAKIPRETSLQRSLASFLASGRRWTGGCSLLPIDEARRLSQNRYKKLFLAAFQESDTSISRKLGKIGQR
jgi:hypothetical protein